MALQTSGAISLSDIDFEFGGLNLGAYRGVTWYRANGTSGTFSASAISMSEFYGKTPFNPGDYGSVSVNAYMPRINKLAGSVVFGDSLLLLSADGKGTRDGAVTGNRFSQQNLLTLVSSSGIRLTCSDNTPLTLEDGSSINSTEALGQQLPVQDNNGFRWEKIVEVLDAGRGEVATISCDDQCYAAGDENGRYIWTHNAQIIKQ